jgi:hypothetical protein
MYSFPSSGCFSSPIDDDWRVLGSEFPGSIFYEKAKISVPSDESSAP